MAKEIASRIAVGLPAALLLIGACAISARAEIRETKLHSADPARFDRLGSCVAISGDTAICGAFGKSDAGNNSGAAYVFRHVEGVWSQEAKLCAADAAIYDAFGSSVGIDGATAIVGAPLDDATTAVTNSGSAYVFVREAGGWTQQAKLTADDAAKDGTLGNAVAVWGDTAVVGAYYDKDRGARAGAAYLYTRENGV